MNEGEVVAGRYRLLQEVGAGGMGVVFKATDLETGTLVAVKILDGQTQQQIDRAHREAEVLARLSHPGIVGHIADGGLAGGSRYVVMEWIDGITVADRLGHHGFTLREAVAVARGVGDALASAHRADVLHRDLKPSNILLVGGDPRKAKLIDFGVARMGDAVHSLTRTGAAIGTPGYMSPEQARGERELVPASDVFGLACVLYECATAKPAFSGTAAAAVMAKILLTEPVPFESVCSEAPEELIRLMQRMLAKAASVRIPDCSQVVAALDAMGEIPDGPRRSARRMTVDQTRVDARSARQSHCTVSAARGAIDDIMEPPSPDQREMLEKAVDAWQGSLEILATGGVVAHVVGEPKEASHRAATIALAMRRILPGWSIAISAITADAETALDHGAALLTQATMAAIFGKVSVDRISVDPSTASLLAGEFELEHQAGSAHLVRQRSTADD